MIRIDELSSVFYLDQFLFGGSQRIHSTHSVFCQVLNTEVALSWHEQPSRRSHLDQSMFCEVFETANKCEAILQAGEAVPKFQADHPPQLVAVLIFV